MSAVISLGRLQSVNLRQAWPDEAKNFTPWLAEEENLSFLANVLGLSLELESVEKPVGPFSADILAKEIGTDRWVLIENQIEATDHGHLGQLLTYAAGLDAAVVIWIARSFREQHRAAIDYLNRISDEDHLFFGVQIELLQIGESAFAPSFSVVAKPNNWSKQSSAGKFAAEESASPSQALYREFWSGLILQAADAYPLLASRKGYKGSWQTAERLASSKDFYVECNASFTASGRLRIEAYIGGPSAKLAFAALANSRQEIEAAVSGVLEWEDLPTKQDARISLYMPGTQKKDDRNAWLSQQKWLLENWKPFAEIMKPYVKALKQTQLGEE